MKGAANSSQQRRRSERIPHAVNIEPKDPEPAKSPAKPSDELKPYPVEIWERE